ncbi:hypothetical protein ANN_16517 [Periplaneta americana]|uniref:Uncharacterized protein n=1 Tax=Periplaneta americana TaxID=6978 RepID=A0ABQ8SRY5_PERAM|nr:hypothetical protein ANN_16517 [Periplaneta americana]
MHITKATVFLFQKPKYPKSVFFIITNEFCERFSYYGMRTILAIYLKNILHYSDDDATVIYHVFAMLCYFFPIFGAMLADSLLGKFSFCFHFQDDILHLCYLRHWKRGGIRSVCNWSHRGPCQPSVVMETCVARAVALYDDGRSVRYIANVMNMARSTTHDAIKRYRETLEYTRRPGSGRPRATNPNEDRYMVFRVLRERNLPAISVAQQFVNMHGRPISAKTVRRRLKASGLISSRPATGPRLLRMHRVERLRFANDHRDWRNGQWSCVLFTDESRFNLCSPDGRESVWRRRGERFSQCCITENVPYGGGEVMVWAGVCTDARTELVFAINFVLMHDNARPHIAHAIGDYLQEVGIHVLPWPARSPDMKPIENVWDMLGQRVKNRRPRSESLQELRRALGEEWELIPQEDIANQIESMPRRVVCAMVFISLTPTVRRELSIVGLLLIAIGTGGIKPCVSAFGGDQFKLPQQEKQLQQFFSLFYFAINSGSLISTFLTPVLREDVKCLDQDSCYPLAFGIPAVLMIISVIIFVIGKRLYIIKEPEGNVVLRVCSCIGHALVRKNKLKEKREHWLDYADDTYDRTLIEDTKATLRVLFLYLPLPIFWALFDQQGSRWTFQATRMTGDLGGWSLKPDQLQVINPLLILAFIPLFETVMYPLLAKCNLLKRPLQRLCVGGVLAAIAFIISAVVELQLEARLYVSFDTYAVLPQAGEAQLRIYNGFNCSVAIQSDIPGEDKFEIPPLDFWKSEMLAVSDEANYQISGLVDGCGNGLPQGRISVLEHQGAAYFITTPKNNPKIIPLTQYDTIDKSDTGEPIVRSVCVLKLSCVLRISLGTDIITKQNYFTYNNKYYTQTEGLPMGSPISSILVEIFLHHIEQTYILNKDNNKQHHILAQIRR